MMNKTLQIQKMKQKVEKAKETGALPQTFDVQAFDFEAYIDNSLTFPENVKIVEREIGMSLEKITKNEAESEVAKSRQLNL